MSSINKWSIDELSNLLLYGLFYNKISSMEKFAGLCDLDEDKQNSVYSYLELQQKQPLIKHVAPSTANRKLEVSVAGKSILSKLDKKMIELYGNVFKSLLNQ